MPRHRHRELIDLIKLRLKRKQPMLVGCHLSKVDYFYNVLSLHFPDRKIEKLEDGVRVS